MEHVQWSRERHSVVVALAGTRRKTISESSDTSSVGGGALDNTCGSPSYVDMDPNVTNRSPSPFSPQTRFSHSENSDQNLSFGNSTQMVYDIDGKFHYSYYESKPILYDIDGTHRYKYYTANKPTPYTEAAPHHEKRPWIYDPVDGRITCLTAKDLKGVNH